MSRFRKILSGILLLFVLAAPTAASGHGGSRRHASSPTHKRNTRPKTVHVRSYKKKNGVVVRAHNRAAPEPKK